MRPKLPILAILIGLAAAACEPDPQPGSGDAPAEEPAAEDATVPILSINRSGVTGTARIEREDDETEIRVELAGLEMGQRYVVDLHDGRCAADGALLVPVGEAVGSQQGVGRVDREIPAEQLDPTTTVFVQITGPDGQVVACADLDGDTETPLTERDTAAERRARELRARDGIEKH